VPLSKKPCSCAATLDPALQRIKSKQSDSYLVSKWQLTLVTNAPDPSKTTYFEQDMSANAMAANAAPNCPTNQLPPVVAMLTFKQTSTPSINQHVLYCHIQALLTGNDALPEIETAPVADCFPSIFNDPKQLNGLLFAASDSLDDDTYNLDGLHACATGAKNNADI
jgi:hypothetical protein